MNSKTNDAEVGICITESLVQYIRRQDLEFTTNGLETCFVDLPREGKRALLLVPYIGIPKATLKTFRELLNPKLHHLNNCGYEVYITGDIN